VLLKGRIMARIVKPLTNTEVKNSKGKEKEYNLADGEGLSLRIKPSDSKNWIFNYAHPISNKRANIGFGIYPEVSYTFSITVQLLVQISFCIENISLSSDY
jgi:hypothetical protein